MKVDENEKCEIGSGRGSEEDEEDEEIGTRIKWRESNDENWKLKKIDGWIQVGTLMLCYVISYQDSTRHGWQLGFLAHDEYEYR